MSRRQDQTQSALIKERSPLRGNGHAGATERGEWDGAIAYGAVKGVQRWWLFPDVAAWWSGEGEIIRDGRGGVTWMIVVLKCHGLTGPESRYRFEALDVEMRG